MSNNLSELNIKEQAMQDVRAELQIDTAFTDLSEIFDGLNKVIRARIDTRVDCVLAGTPWVEAALASVSDDWSCTWLGKEGELFKAGSTLATITAVGSKLLTVERTMLNFLQLLSGVATKAKRYVDLAGGIPVLDTRKTIPGLRIAQKYAAKIGGMQNNRSNMYESIIIKENYIIFNSITSICKSLEGKKQSIDMKVEVTNFNELQEALDNNINYIMLDNWTVENTIKAVKITNNKAKLESTGSINETNIKQYANTGIDYISCGSVTKNPDSIDLTLLIEQ